MKHSIASRLIFALSTSMTLFACGGGTVTELPTTWRAPNSEASTFSRLFVIGVAQNDGSRRLFEDEFVKALNERGVAAAASWTVLPHSTQLSEDELRSAVAAGNFDAVLITRLAGVEEKSEYVPGYTYSSPSSPRYYYPYYGRSYATVHEPGYMKTEKVVILETSLYSAASGELVWWGRSDTIAPESVADATSSMTHAVAKKLEDEKLVP